MGHILSVCQDTKIPPAQIHAITTGHDDASESSKEESVIILTQVDEALLTQKASTSTSPCPINSDLLLLDSQSTVHFFLAQSMSVIFAQWPTPFEYTAIKGPLILPTKLTLVIPQCILTHLALLMSSPFSAWVRSSVSHTTVNIAVESFRFGLKRVWSNSLLLQKAFTL